jgi:hypothetical protein
VLGDVGRQHGHAGVAFRIDLQGLLYVEFELGRIALDARRVRRHQQHARPEFAVGEILDEVLGLLHAIVGILRVLDRHDGVDFLLRLGRLRRP